MSPLTPTADASALIGFRTGLHSCLTGWADAGFEVCEALLCTPGPVHSVPALSLEPVFRRGHGSLYKALRGTRVDAAGLRALLVAHRPPDWPNIFAVDASAWARSDAECSPERGYYYSASQHSAGQPIVAGWNYSWIVQLGWQPDSWTAPVDVTRIPPRTDTTTATVTQIRDLVTALQAAPGAGTDPTPMFVFDAGYDPAGLTHELTGTTANLVVRIRSDRVFYTNPPPPEPGAGPGRPRRHGDRFTCADPATWPEPDYQATGHDDRYGSVQVRAWTGLHPRLSGCRGHFAGHTPAPIVTGTIIRVQVEHLPKPTSRASTTLWLWAAGPDPNPDTCARAYLHRFDIEHTFRYLKGTLGWTLPRLCTPQQADTWTWIIAAAHTQLRLAKPLVADHKLGWEKPLPQHRLTPTRVRRGFMALTPTLGTPAHPPKTRTPGPGRPKGTKTGPRKRHPAIKKKAA